MTDRVRALAQRLQEERQEAVEALRALNSAIWKHDPKWAVASGETRLSEGRPDV